tara:strand:- start:1969 stop:2385 length:417 start_codon:yes stop_codon:yes gene_type:complete
MSINIKNLDDYKEYLLDVCGWDEERVEAEAEYHFSDFNYEAIRLSWKEGTVTTMVENTEREGYDPVTRSWPAFIKKEVSRVWRHCDTIETGGYWEVYDVDEDFYRYFTRCTCDTAQFVWYNTDDKCGKCFIEDGGCNR